MLIPRFDPRFDPRSRDPFAHAPSRNVSPNTCPKREHVRQFLQERGIDPDDLRALWRVAAVHRWLWRISGG